MCSSDLSARSGVNSAGLTDPLTATDQLSGVIAPARLLVDASAGTDQVTGTTDAARALADPVVVTDALAATRAAGNAGTVVDPLTVLDQLEATWARAVVLEDPVKSDDSPTMGRTLSITDSLTLSDLMMLFNGPTRDLTLTLTVLPDRYASHVSPNRYEARVP